MSRKSSPARGLVYIGRATLPGLPARDLRAEEVEALGGEAALLATGLYAVAEDAEPEPVIVPVEVEANEEPDLDE